MTIERRRSRKRLAALRAAPIIGCLCVSVALAPISGKRGNLQQAPAARPDTSQETSKQTQTSAPDPSISDASAPLPRGKKLALKDGSFQMVREYQVNGDRVRYYSLDSSQWEEIPTSLVDWDATKKIEAEEAQRDAAFAARVHLREQGRGAEALDIDASVEVAPGVFLPPGQGLFLFDGRSIARVAQAQTSSSLDKKRVVEQVLVPIPHADAPQYPGRRTTLDAQDSGQPTGVLQTFEERHHAQSESAPRQSAQQQPRIRATV